MVFASPLTGKGSAAAAAWEATQPDRTVICASASLPVPAPPPLLLLLTLPPRTLQMFLLEKAAAALSLPVSISPVVWLHPAVMELLIVPPFPSPSFHEG